MRLGTSRRLSFAPLRLAGEYDHQWPILAYYVYCIAESAAAAELPVDSLPAAIEDNSKLEWVSVNGLAALASQVPRATYSEENLAEHLTDATWTAIRAMRHETVVEYVAKRTTVIPLRFGTIYLERGGIEQMLTDRSRGARIDHRATAWTRRVGREYFCDRAVLLSSITSVSPVLRDLVQRAEQAPPGQSYLMQKKIETLKVDEARAAVNRDRRPDRREIKTAE